MTLEALKNRVRIRRASGPGLYEVFIDYRGRQYRALTNNSMAYDRVIAQYRLRDRDNMGYYTLKEAYQTLWDTCKEVNALR